MFGSSLNDSDTLAGRVFSMATSAMVYGVILLVGLTLWGVAKAAGLLGRDEE